MSDPIIPVSFGVFYNVVAAEVARRNPLTANSGLNKPLPVVYGTSRVTGITVFMKDRKVNQITPQMVAKPESLLVFPDSHPAQVYPPQVNPVFCQTMSTGPMTTTTCYLYEYPRLVQVSTWRYLPIRRWNYEIQDYELLGPTIHFHTGPNAGLTRDLVQPPVPTSSQTFTWTPALPVANPAGVLVTIGLPYTQGVCASVATAICEAPAGAVLRYWYGSRPPTTTPYSLTATNATNETVVSATASTWAPMEADANAQGMTFSGAVQFRTNRLALENGAVPDLSFEVRGLCAGTPDGSGVADANPADVILDLLSSQTHGLGWSTSNIVTDVGSDGLAASSYRTYCTAMGFLVSRTIDQQAGINKLIEELLDQTNATAIWSDGKLKVVPLGDVSVTANGATYTPPLVALSVGVDDILVSGSDDPITVRRVQESDVFNTFPVAIKARAADYINVTVEEIEPAHAAVNGIRRASSVNADWISTEAHAKALSSIKAQRSINIRNVYRFRLGPRFSLLEPLDFISLTDSVFGLSSTLCRIKSIEEEKDGRMTIEAWEWPVGSATPLQLPVQTYEGYNAPAYIPVAPQMLAAGAAVEAEQRADKNLSNVEDGSVTAAKVDIPLLSDITADVGVLTAGVIQNVAGTAKFDLTNSKVIFDNGTVVKITGLGFGTSSQLIEWVGLRADIVSGGNVNPALCSTSNSIQHITTTGDAYFKGTLNVGTISNSGQTTDTSSTASIDVGPFGSNGDTITVAYSLTCGGTALIPSAAPAGVTNYSTSHTIVVERSVNGGAFSQVGTQTITSSQTRTMEDWDAESGTYLTRTISTTVSGSFTYSDTLNTTQDRIYRLRITARTLGYGTYTGFTQRLSLTTQEL